MAHFGASRSVSVSTEDELASALTGVQWRVGLPGSLADLGHREVGIGPSEALAACESIRISL